MTGIRLLLLCLTIHGFSPSQGEVLKDQLDQYRLDFIFNLEDRVWTHWKRYGTTAVVYNRINYFMKTMKNFDSDKLDQITEDLMYGVKPLKGFTRFTDLQMELKVIDVTYQKFKRYRTACLQKEGRDCDFSGLVDDVMNDETGINVTLMRLQDILYGRGENIREELHKFTSINQYWCKGIPQSVQQLYYNLYNLLSRCQLQTYILLQVVYILKLNDDKQETDWYIESSKTRSYYKKLVATAFDKLRVAGQNRHIQRCDPQGFIKGTNYEEFTRLLQGHVENEVDMSSGSTCRGSCDSYSYTKSYRCYDYQSDYCRKIPRCNGAISGCFFVEEDASICVSKNPTKRYEYVTYQSGKTLGKKTHCSERRTVNSWLRWFVRCHYCMCLCNEEGPKSDRYISLRPAYSNVTANMVVTGMRFKKHNRILHLQIQEGKLLPFGKINQETVHWVDVSGYKITDRNVQNEIDFLTMTFTKRSMAMDDIQLDNNHVVTGVRFIKGRNGDKSMIQLEVLGHQFDWATGQIKIPDTVTNIDHDFRNEIRIQKPDVPTRTDFQSEMQLGGGKKYVTFTHTDFDKDAAQTTIPFIDLQEVATEPATLLSGAGVFYRGNNGYGGFIAPRIKTFDYGRLLTKGVPDNPHV